MAYNISLLNTIKPALDESLEHILNQIKKCENGEIQQEQLDIVNESQKLKSALSSVNKKGLEFGAKLLLTAAEGLTDADSRGWDGMQSQKVLFAMKELVNEIKNILDSLVNYVDVKSVFLFPYINELNRAMNVLEEISPDELFEFEITDKLNKTAYSPKDLETLKKQLKNLKPYFDKVLESIENKSGSIEIQMDITKAIKTVERFEKLRHRRGYYPFWVLLKARLAYIGILGSSDHDIQILKEAFFEIRKFADGQKNPTENTLMELANPFIHKELARHVYMGTPVFKELYEMLSLKGWFEAKEKALNLAVVEQKKDFQIHTKEMNETIYTLEQKWTAFDDLMNHKITDKRLDYAIADVEKAIDGLFSVKIWLDTINVNSAFGAMTQIRSHLNDIDSSVSLEFARLIHLIGVGVNTYNQSDEFKQSVDDQSHRLMLAFQRQTRELENVSIVNIGEFSKKERLAKAMASWSKEASSELKTVETILHEWIEKNSIIDRIPLTLPVLSGFSGAFSGFQKEDAKAITDWLIEKLQIVSSGREADDLDKVPLAFGSISHYISFLEKNDFSSDTESEIFAKAMRDILHTSGKQITDQSEPDSSLDADISENENMFGHVDIETSREDVGHPDVNHEEEIPFSIKEDLVPESSTSDDVVEPESFDIEENEENEDQQDDVEEQEESHVDSNEQEYNENSSTESSVESNYFDKNNESHTDFKEESEGVIQNLNGSINNIYELLSTNRKTLTDEDVKENSVDIRRAWHSFKGSSAMCGFFLFSKYSKFMEDSLDEFVESNGIWTIDRIKWLENALHQATEYLEGVFNKKISLHDDVLVTEDFPEIDVQDELISPEFDDIFRMEDSPTTEHDEGNSPIDNSNDIRKRILDIPYEKPVEATLDTEEQPVHKNLEQEQYPETVVEIHHEEKVINDEIKDEPIKEVSEPTSDESLDSDFHSTEVEIHHVFRSKEDVWGEILEKMNLIEETQSEVTKLFTELSKIDTMNLLK